MRSCSTICSRLSGASMNPELFESLLDAVFTNLPPSLQHRWNPSGVVMRTGVGYADSCHDIDLQCKTFVTRTLGVAGTWTTNVCKAIAFWARFRGSGYDSTWRLANITVPQMGEIRTSGMQVTQRVQVPLQYVRRPQSHHIVASLRPEYIPCTPYTIHCIPYTMYLHGPFGSQASPTRPARLADLGEEAAIQPR